MFYINNNRNYYKIVFILFNLKICILNPFKLVDYYIIYRPNTLQTLVCITSIHINNLNYVQVVQIYEDMKIFFIVFSVKQVEGFLVDFIIIINYPMYFVLVKSFIILIFIIIFIHYSIFIILVYIYYQIQYIHLLVFQILCICLKLKSTYNDKMMFCMIKI